MAPGDSTITQSSAAGASMLPQEVSTLFVRTSPYEPRLEGLYPITVDAPSVRPFLLVDGVAPRATRRTELEWQLRPMGERHLGPYPTYAEQTAASLLLLLLLASLLIYRRASLHLRYARRQWFASTKQVHAHPANEPGGLESVPRLGTWLYAASIGLVGWLALIWHYPLTGDLRWIALVGACALPMVLTALRWGGMTLALRIARSALPSQQLWALAQTPSRLAFALSIPIALLVGFLPRPPMQALCIALGVLMVAVATLRSLRVGRTLREVNARRFYFFLYLCTLEIVPTLAVIRLIYNAFYL